MDAVFTLPQDKRFDQDEMKGEEQYPGIITSTGVSNVSSASPHPCVQTSDAVSKTIELHGCLSLQRHRLSHDASWQPGVADAVLLVRILGWPRRTQQMTTPASGILKIEAGCPSTVPCPASPAATSSTDPINPKLSSYDT